MAMKAFPAYERTRASGYMDLTQVPNTFYLLPHPSKTAKRVEGFKRSLRPHEHSFTAAFVTETGINMTKCPCGATRNESR